MRVDYNVPLKDGAVADTTRIAGSLPSVDFIKEHGARNLVLMSHLGRPKGERHESMSLKHIMPAVEDILKSKVTFLDDCVGADVQKRVAEGKPGEIFMLENLRFHLEEEGKGVVGGEKVKADPEKVRQFRYGLTDLADIYINEAFGTCHRAHSSMVGINVETRAAGFLVKKELDFFAKVLENPDRPLTMLLGGAKVSDKIQLIKNMMTLADNIIIGGGMAYTFNHVINGTRIGKSLFDLEGARLVPEIMKEAIKRKVNIHIPRDFVCCDSLTPTNNITYRCQLSGIEDNEYGLDIGMRTTKEFVQVINASKTLFWNGPMGMFETEPFDIGSRVILNAVQNQTKAGNLISVVGGGDTVNLINSEGAENNISHISTGGGASLELVEGHHLPGVEALSDVDSIL